MSTDTPGTSTSFGPLKQVDAGVLTVGYAEAGPADGPAVVLLHGWPYDIHSYVEVVPLLAAAGYRAIIPYLRGFGTTRFRSDATFRNGEQAALALDVIALLDALAIDHAILTGFDWRARTADTVAALWPERCRGLVAVSGYLIGSQQAGKLPLPPEAELQWWYQYYFATERGRAGYDHYRRDFAKLIWRTASPRWTFDDANGAPHPDPSSYARKFSGEYSHRTIAGGVGHNLPQEAPDAFADAVLEVGGRGR
jgi:pimeloyl-ACP methyl ester carboxylesterase